MYITLGVEGMCMGSICQTALLVESRAILVEYFVCVCDTRCRVYVYGKYVYGMHLSNGSFGSIYG